VTTYVAFSGGADSTAMAILLKEQGHEIELVFSDTGAELPETYWMIPRVAEKLGAELSVTTNGTFFSWFVGFGYLLPSMHRRWCTRLLKQSPQTVFGKKVEAELAVGIRADEPHRMPDAPRPLLDADMDKNDCLALCEKHDLLNPCYKWRSSCSCFCCPFQRKNDWRHLLDEHPVLFALAEEWERLSVTTGDYGFGWNQGWRLEEMRNATEAQLALFDEPREEACLICQW